MKSRGHHNNNATTICVTTCRKFCKLPPSNNYVDDKPFSFVNRCGGIGIPAHDCRGQKAKDLIHHDLILNIDPFVKRTNFLVGKTFLLVTNLNVNVIFCICTQVLKS